MGAKEGAWILGEVEGKLEIKMSVDLIIFATETVCAYWTSGINMEGWLMTDRTSYMMSHRSPDCQKAGNIGPKCSSIYCRYDF